MDKREANRLRGKRYREKHGDDYRAYQREYHRRTRIGVIINGIRTTIYGLNKRSYPDKCEVCQDINRRLVYHHWDDTNFNKGLWLCSYCHWLAERYESGHLDIYKKRKQEVEEESK